MSTSSAALSLEDLRQIAIEGFSGISRTFSAATGEGAGEGKYVSLPLEGRLDLMRPRPGPERGAEAGASADGPQTPGAGVGDQHTFDDRAGSLTPKMRPISFYVSDAPHDRPTSDSAPYELPYAPHFGPELGATIFSTSGLSSAQRGWQPPAAASGQIQSGPTFTFPQDQTRGYFSTGPTGPPPLSYNPWTSSQSGPEYSRGTGDQQVQDVQGPYIGPQHATQSGGGTFPQSGQIEGTLPGGTYPQGALGYPHGHQPSERGHVSTSAVTWRPPLGSAEQIPGSSGQHGLPPELVYQVTQRQPQTYQSQESKEAHVQGGVQVPSVGGAQQVHPEQSLFLRHDLESTHGYGHQQAPPSQEPARPVSPPLVVWNPAVEPPPNVAPVSNFPSTTYYPNVWDQSPSHYRSDSSLSPVTSSPHFTIPPPSRIPERLLQERHYTNVLGEGKQGETPSPDRAKIKPVFPWEDKPRLTPGRVFPATDSPPPGQFLQPAVGTASPSPSPPLRFSPAQSYGSRPSGFPSSLPYGNAWDVVPDIQKYASRLVRPPQNISPLGPAFDFSESSRRRESALFKTWNESGESSVDGDDEDTGDEGGLSPPSKQRPRSGSSTGKVKGHRKEYRSQGVQTIPKETRDQSVQVTILVDPADADRSIKDKDERPSRSREGSYHGVLSALTKQQEFSPPRSSVSGRQEPVTPYTTDIPKLSPLGSPTGLRSPRYTSPRGSSTNLAESTPRPVNYKPVQRPSTPQRGGELQRVPPSSISRTFSSDTASSPSSAGPPISPEEPRPVRRASGRVWDPARGVEIFKKGSEEVLSRFLKMGSWEEEKQS